MSLVRDIINHFTPSNWKQEQGLASPVTIQDFIDRHPKYKDKLIEIRGICQRLVNKEKFVYLGTNSHHPSLVGDTFLSLLKSSDYECEFLVYGFPYIRQYFLKSVCPLFVKNKNGDEDVGSAFYVSGIGFVTAAHCVREMQAISIVEHDITSDQSVSVYVPVDERLDLALIQVDPVQYQHLPGFAIRNVNMLEEVLTMGFPPIPGFDSILVSEKAHIAGELKSTVGRVVAEGDSYLDGQGYLLISARVKGGNSGGPVIGEDGKVVGVISQAPADEQQQLDSLGYGVMIPAATLSQFLTDCANNTESVVKLNGLR